MITRHAPTTMLLMGLAILTGCDLGTSPGGSSSPFLLAEAVDFTQVESIPVNGTEVDRIVSHRGGAKISGGTAAPDNYALKVASWDTEQQSSFKFEFLNTRIWELEEGPYELEPIAPLPAGRPGTVGVSALYVVDGSHYVSESGTVKITGIQIGRPIPGDEHRVEGTFEVTLVFLCRPSVNRDQCWAIPNSFPEGLPRLRVTGTFAAESDSRPVPTLPGSGT